jgi:YHS domain-containing protein
MTGVAAEPMLCPVCGTMVDSPDAPSATYGEETYHFCSEGCRDQFVADPGSFVEN